MGDWEWELGDWWEARRWDGGGSGWGLLVGVVVRACRAYGGVVTAMCAVVWVVGPVVGVLSWSSGCGATPSLALNRESIA